MTQETEKHIEKKLLEKVNSSGKIYLIKDINNIAKECDVRPKDVTKVIQKSYLQSYSNFKYDLTKTRNSIKILALEKPVYNVNSIEYMADSYDSPNSDVARYILSQFAPHVELEDIKKIYEFYTDITYDMNKDLDILYLAINRESESLYIKTRFSVREVDYIVDLIAKYGYAYEKDNILYWKAYSPNVIVEEEDLIDQFTIINKKMDNIQEKETVIQQEDLKQEQIQTMRLDTRTALSHIAKELGMPLNENDSREKLEEMVATTNELITNFGELPDWEKLKSWNTFVLDWQAIMGDALNDRN